MATGLLYSLLLSLAAAHTALGITCFICGQTNLPSPGECTTQFQYDCSTVDPTQQQQRPRNAGTKMLCRTTRNKLGPGLFSVGKECVTEDEHLSTYPEGKAFGCETLFPNGTNEVTYCVCDRDSCNGKPLDEQVQVSYSSTQVQRDGVFNIPIGGPPPGQDILPFPPPPPPPPQQQILQQQASQLQQASQQLQQASQQNQQQFEQQLQQNSQQFGRTPPGIAPVVGPNGEVPVVVPPLILPNNSVALGPFPAGQTFAPNNKRPNNNAAPQQIFAQESKQVSELQQAQAVIPINLDGVRPVNAASKPSEDSPAQIAPQQEPVLIPGISTHQLQPSLNWTSLAVDHSGDTFADDHNNQQPRNQWPIQTVTNHLVAEPKNNLSKPILQLEAASLTCLMCADTNVSVGGDCRKQIPIDCSRQFPPELRVYCITKETVAGQQISVEKHCVSEEIVVREFGVTSGEQNICGQTRERPPSRFCICAADQCNNLPIEQQTKNNSPKKVSNNASRLPAHQSPSSIQQQPSEGANGHQAQTQTKCYVCGESDMQHPSDCSQQYEYSCSQQYPANANAGKILCLTRQTKLANGLFSIEKRCIAESEHKQQYPGAQVVVDGCGEAWNGYVQYCVCVDDESGNNLCNGPNITVQQNNHGYTPSDLLQQHQPTDPFTTHAAKLPASSSLSSTAANSTLTVSASKSTTLADIDDIKSTKSTSTPADPVQQHDVNKKLPNSKQTSAEFQKSSNNKNSNPNSSTTTFFVNRQVLYLAVVFIVLVNRRFL